MAPLYHAIHRRGVQTTTGEREIVAIVPWESEAEGKAILSAVARALKTAPSRLEVTNCPGWPFERMNPNLDYRTGATYPDWPVEGFKLGMSPIENMFPGAHHVIVNSEDQTFECRNCNSKDRPELPMTAAGFLCRLKAFEKMHADCIQREDSK